MNYSQKLRDPNWLAVREKVLVRDGKRCVHNPNHKMPLEVHHLSYGLGREPWDYPLQNFRTLCRDCHLAEHGLNLNEPHPPRQQGRFYARHQIKSVVGHSPSGFLTQVDQRIVCGCFHLDLNPDAPDVVLPGTRNDWLQKAALFSRQAGAIPIFVKGEGLPWEFVGQYRVETTTRNASELTIHRQRAGRADIGLVMFLSVA